MKNITVSAGRVKKELIFFLISILFALIMNIYSIIIYQTQWIELITTLHITFLLSIVIYIIIGIFRIIWRLLRSLVIRLKSGS